MADSTSSNESTTTQNTTPQKKEDSLETQTVDVIENTEINDADQAIEQQCPDNQIPLESLTEDELAQALACKRDEKNKISQTVDKIEELIEQKQEEKRSKPKKKTNRCPYSSTPLKKLKAPELEEVYAYTQTHTMDSPFMIHLLERLIALSDNHASVKKYKLQLAETHYAAHHIEKAAIYYEDFAMMYPGSKECEYVLYKAVVCMFELSLEPDRDQTNTRKTITLIKEYLKRARKQDLIEEANLMLQQCYNRLYDHEVYVFNFYTKKKNFVAAELRLDYIGKSFTQTIPNIDQKVEALKAQLHLAKNPVKPSRKYIVNKLLA